MAEERPGIDGVDLFMRPYDWPPPGSGAGQCMACGFLTRRSTDQSRPGIEEVTVEDRKAGRLFSMVDGRPSLPWCFVRPSSDVDLNREVEAIAAGRRAESGLPEFVQVSNAEADVMSVLTLDRKCPEWWWYTQFLSPVEHREERDMRRLEDDRRAFQLRLTQLEQRAADTANKTALYNWLTVVTIGVIGLGIGVLTVTAALYPNEIRDLIEAVAQWIGQRLQ